MKKVYLDYAATSPVKSKVLKAMMPYFACDFGNASSIHFYGRKAKEAIESSRKMIADHLNCNPDEIIFTSGGTESDNLSIRGIVYEYISNELMRKKKTHKFINSSTHQCINSSTHQPHIITSAFEHHAVLNVCKDLEKRGLVEVTYIKPDSQGIINVDSIKNAIKKNTVLVSIMYVNNEIGTVQPITEIGNLIKELNKRSDSTNSTFSTLQHIYFHSDAVQAIEYQNCDVKKLGVDMMTLSAHKIGGPKGVGVLYVKRGTVINSQNIGGKQEFGLRAGTENTPNIIGMGKAIKSLIANRLSQIASIKNLRDYFIDRILKEIPDTRLNGDRVKRSPNNINISFKYVEGEAILLHLDAIGIAASSGSACTSNSLDPSHVLLSIGLKPEDAHGSIRFTLGEKTTKKEIDYTIQHLKKIVKKLRKISPFGKNK